MDLIIFHRYAVQKYRTKECLGTREVLGVEDEVQKSGKVFQKLQLGEYKWMTYEAWNSLLFLARFCKFSTQFHH